VRLGEITAAPGVLDAQPVEMAEGFEQGRIAEIQHMIVGDGNRVESRRGECLDLSGVRLPVGFLDRPRSAGIGGRALEIAECEVAVAQQLAHMFEDARRIVALDEDVPDKKHRQLLLRTHRPFAPSVCAD
jgi:hypothetical protein